VFSRSWICVGRIEQVAEPGDCLATEVAGEPVLVVRGEDGTIRALSAICQHRGEIIPCPEKGKALRCPLHFWTYDFEGRLAGAPRMGDAEAVQQLRRTVRLPTLNLELWHGFIFVNLDPQAAHLAPSLAKLEPLWPGYEATGLKALPPAMSDTPLPWNWKVQVENFTDAYHPEYVHIGTHDFAPSVMAGDGVRFTAMRPDDNAIVRSVPMRRPDGGMMKDGWGPEAAFPAIATLPLEQRSRITFAMLPPSLTMMFAPGTVAYTLIRPIGAEATLAGSDRVTYGGWLLPQSTLDLPDLQARCAAVSEGGSKIWAQDVPINRGMQAAKHSRFLPGGTYGPLETTLQQFNVWLLNAYRRAMAG
jgi:phenylpropionate dioxygenase-like ring-hydroxylating dioxygenase large terminal subunit